VGSKLKRLAPVVLISDGLAYTTKNFEKEIYLGEPQNLVRTFSELDAHEIAVIHLGILSDEVLTTLEAMSKGSYVPLHFAGGVNSAESAGRVTALGFEKIGIEVRSLERDLTIISEVSSRVGSTSTSASLSVIRDSTGLFKIWDWKAKSATALDLKETLRVLNGSGCGEIKISSVNCDGEQLGPDFDLAKLVRTSTKLPIVYQGGVSSLSQVESLWELGIDCVASGTMLSTYGKFKAALAHYPSSKELKSRWNQ
jgi:cyclase